MSAPSVTSTGVLSANIAAGKMLECALMFVSFFTIDMQILLMEVEICTVVVRNENKA